jgi:hypothetical protein
LPAVSNVTVNGDVVPVADLVTPALLDVQVAVYPVTGGAPLFGGGAIDTAIWPGLGVTAVTDGAPGSPGITTADDGADAGPVPTAFFATTVQV